MTETPEQPGETGTGGTRTAERPAGIDTAHLRNYESLRRSTTDRKVAGVAGGLGRHLDVDPTLLRVLFVVLCFFGGAGFVLYGAAWLLVPEDGRAEGKISTNPGTRNVLLIGAGFVAALLLLGDGWSGVGFPWPAVLVGVGVLVYLAFRRRDRPTAQPQPPAHPAASPGAFPAAGSPAGTTSGTMPGTTSAMPAAGVTEDAPTTATSWGDGEQPPPWTPATRVVPPYQPPKRPKRGPRLFGPTLALIAVALGVLGLAQAAGADVVPTAYPALALALVGAMLVLGSVFGRPGGLVLLGITSALALAVTSVVALTGGLDAPQARIDVHPTSADRVRDSYTFRSGQATIDLSRIEDPQALTDIDVRGRAGEIVVVLPPRSVRTTVTADISGPGQVEVLDEQQGGLGTHLARSYGGGRPGPRITLHLSAGHIDVRNS